MAQAYGSLAEWFEILNDDCGYDEWSQYFIDGLARYGAGARGLELGCGSGAFCRALAKAGYRMSGADNCVPMLSKAEKLAREAGLKIDFFFTDAASMTAAAKYDFILSPNDVFNYVPQEKLFRAFQRVYRYLNAGGLFWFDVSSPYKLCEKVANNICADDREDVTYLSFNRRAENRVEMDVTLFVRRPDGAFDRFDERHVQYIHEEGDLSAALRRAGFEILSVEGSLGEEKEGSDRLNFICRKQ